jgi:hypothetical protein
MTHKKETGDLLTLIGQSMDELRQSIRLFESSEREKGVKHLAAVVEAIDSYLDRLDSDPLLRLAPMAPERIRTGLADIRRDLDEVMRGLPDSPP